MADNGYSGTGAIGSGAAASPELARLVEGPSAAGNVTDTSQQQAIAAVVIGRNEGPRLAECLRSVQASVEFVVYADSGSKDGSPETAESLGARCVRITTGPFTAARGRHEGMELVLRERPDTEFILFIDGDCILQPGFVAAAATHLRAHPMTTAVAGRVREQGTGFWSRVVDIEWDVPHGPSTFVGGISLMRARAVQEVGGWPIDVIAGEEPDLCLRMADKGYGCHILPMDMALHDARMTRFGQYWRRSLRAGHAYAEVAWRQRNGLRGDRTRAIASMVLYAAVLPMMIGLALWLFWPAAIVFALAYVRVVLSMTLRLRRTGRSTGLSLSYALLTVVGKCAGLLGVARFVFGLVTGRRSRIIESRRAAMSGHSANTGAPTSVPVGKLP